MRTLRFILVAFLAGCSGGVALTDATAPAPSGPSGGRQAPEPRDAGGDPIDGSSDAGPLAGDPQP
ncbi:MAG TPA: hypothetical protein VFD38_07465, partial [Myxococcaceae bacterium]|nr:hypothetical protein [Myxococcaceae bacterium]